MAVDEARHNGAALEVDDLCLLAAHRDNIAGAADGEDFAVADRQCFGRAVGGIHGMDSAVAENEVGVVGTHGSDPSLSAIAAATSSA